LKIQLNQYYAELLANPSGVRNLAELIAFDNANPTLEEPAGFKDQSMYAVISFNKLSIANLCN
jgi:amidase